MADREPKRRTRSVVEPAPERRRVDWREALRLRRLGLTDSEIGRQLRFKSSSITRCLERHGVERREQSSDDPRNRRPELRALRSAWEKMRRRCDDPSYESYDLHGGVGARVCDAWRSFEDFAAWALQHGFEKGLWLARIDECGNYEPGNCRWVSRSVGRQKATGGRAPKPPGWRITAFGETKNAAEWVRDPRCSITISSLIKRLRKGWPAERAIAEPRASAGRGPRRLIRAFGEEKSLSDWARDLRCSITMSSLRERLRDEWHPDDAISLPRYAAKPLNERKGGTGR